MRRIAASLVTFLALATVATVQAEYITDELRVEMRSGASNEYRIINYLPAGANVDVLNRSNGFVQVRTDRGSEGWIDEQYLANQPSARDRLAALERRMQNTLARATDTQSQMSSVQDQLEAANMRIVQLTGELESTQEELTEVKRISAGAIADHAEKQRLSEQNVRLRDELEDMAAERERLASNTQRQWLLIGAGLVLLGLLIGAVIKSRPRRSAWS